LRAGTPGDSGVLVVTRVRSTTTSAHEAAGAKGIRRSPRPLRGGRFKQCLGRMASRGRECVFGVEMSTLVMPGKSAKRVFALDDPGIHQSSQEHFRRRWIAGSSPAMTALQRIAFGCLKIESIVALATRTVCSLPPCRGELERGVATSTNLAATPPSLTLPQSQVGPARLAQDKMQPRQARVAGERERGGARTALKQPFFCCERLSPCYKPAATVMMISDELYPESLS